MLETVDSDGCTGWSESIILHMSRGYFLFEESHTQTDQCFCQWGQLLHLLDFLPFSFLWETTFVTSFFLSCTSIPSWKGVFSERKEFANSFLLEKTPFQKGDIVILTELPPLKVFSPYMNSKDPVTRCAGWSDPPPVPDKNRNQKIISDIFVPNISCWYSLE